MARDEFLLELDELLELPRGTLRGPEKLAELEQWNSTAMIGFLALADSSSGVRLSPRAVIKCATVADLLSLAKADGAASAA
jgi:hypothetical protein